MILFDLLCSHGHRFEAWFRDSDGFERLASVGEIQCTICGDTAVKKALMAPNVRTSKSIADHRADDRDKGPDGAKVSDEKEPMTAPATENGGQVVVPAGADAAAMPPPEKLVEAMKVLRQVQTHIEKNFDHVGRKFADEARKMHYGEAEKRSIYGEATKEEAEQLADEGIEVNSMPWLPTRNS
jgi:hypothetical protein